MSSSSGRSVDQYPLVTQPMIQPAPIMVAADAAKVSVVERNERILIHSLRRTRTGVTGWAATVMASADERGGASVRVLMTLS